jgi:hypothetical protein
MSDTHVRGEMHGCVVCGRLYELYVVYGTDGKFMDCKVMSPDAKRVPDSRRPLVACNRHTKQEIDAAMARTYGRQATDE